MSFHTDPEEKKGSPLKDFASPKHKDRFRSFLDKPSRFQYPNNKKHANFRKAGAGGIIVDADSEKLLVVKGTTKWSLPKGHLDKGEKYHQCAMREIQEETNLNIDLDINDRFIDVKKYVYYIVHLHNIEEIDLKTNDPEEIQDVKWLPVKDVKQLDCNRQLEYVVSRWDYIKSIIENYKEKVTKFPLPSFPKEAKCQLVGASESESESDSKDSREKGFPVRQSLIMMEETAERALPDEFAALHQPEVEVEKDLEKVVLPCLGDYFSDYT